MSAPPARVGARTSRARSLRGRVAAGVALVVVAGLALAGVVGVLSLQAYLLARTDTQLTAARTTVEAALEARDQPVLREAVLRSVLAAGLDSGVVHLLHDGEPVVTLTAGGVVPTALDLTASGAAPAWLGPDLRGVRLETADLQVQLSDGSRVPVDAVVLARQTDADSATVARAAVVATVTALLVATAAVAATWWAVGRGLRPLQHMAADADRVAAGDRTVRLGRRAEHTETAALARAVDGALDARDTAERRVREFVADAAHELRTPLTAVHGWADLYVQGGLDAAGTDHAMERIGDATGRMRHLVEEMALLARLDADQPLDREPVDLAAVVRDVLADLDVLAPDREVTVAAAGPVTVTGDAVRLRQVVTNLVGNVLRHTPAGTPFDVAVVRDGGQVRLTVHDDGPGVPAEVAARAFERFVRRGTGSGEARGGSGLGLAIVAAVVAAHGGTVGLDSDTSGTTVRVVLPAA